MFLWHARRGGARRALGAVGVTAALLLTSVAGCEGKQEAKAPAGPPPPIYTGPAFLRGTVGSLARLRGYEPLPVSGWGFVVNLDDTGANSAPIFMRQWLINYLRKQGVGSARLRAQNIPLANMSPERLIADPSNAVVEVVGFIPPAAPRGSRFDVIVSAVEGTQTTSLERGLLYPAELGLLGSNRQMQFTRPLAMAEGPVYINPIADWADDNAKLTQRRKAVILSGGVVDEDRRIELVLNQPSYTRAIDVADRINERFPAAPRDRRPTAEAKSDLIVRINVPAQFHDDPSKLLALVSNLYIQRAEGFELAQAQTLGDVLVANPDYASDIALAWQALGQTIRPVLRKYYDYPDPRVSLAALEAGAGLGDELTTDHLANLVSRGDPAVRKRVAAALVHLPSSLRGNRTLRSLLDDSDTDVRIAAYDSLVTVGDPLIRRVPIYEDQGRRLKFYLDLVPAEKPLVYVTQSKMPTLVIFNPDQPFATPLLARVWDNHLIIKCESPDDPATVMYQPPGKAAFQSFHIAPTLANLAFLLAREPIDDLNPLAAPGTPGATPGGTPGVGTSGGAEDDVNRTGGLALSYSQVVNAAYNLCEAGKFPAPILVQQSPIALLAEKLAKQLPDAPRPETAPPGSTPAPGETPAEAPAPGARPPTADQADTARPKGNGSPFIDLPGEKPAPQEETVP